MLNNTVYCDKKSNKREEEDTALLGTNSHVNRDADECALAHNKRWCMLAGVVAWLGLLHATDANTQARKQREGRMLRSPAVWWGSLEHPLPIADRVLRLVLPWYCSAGLFFSSGLVSAQQGLPAGEQWRVISLRLQTWLFVVLGILLLIDLLFIIPCLLNEKCKCLARIGWGITWNNVATSWTTIFLFSKPSVVKTGQCRKICPPQVTILPCHGDTQTCSCKMGWKWSFGQF